MSALTDPEHENELEAPGDENPELDNELIEKRKSLLRLQRRLLRAQRLRELIPKLENSLRVQERVLDVESCPRKKGAVTKKIRGLNKKLEEYRNELQELIKRNHYLTPAELIEEEKRVRLTCEKTPAKAFEYALVAEANSGEMGSNNAAVGAGEGQEWEFEAEAVARGLNAVAGGIVDGQQWLEIEEIVVEGLMDNEDGHAIPNDFIAEAVEDEEE
jgi:hypothetical protein